MISVLAVKRSVVDQSKLAQLTKQKIVANSENDDESDDVTTNTSEEKTTSHRIEAEILFEKPNPIVDRIPAKQPKFEKKRDRGGPYQPRGAR